MRALHFGAGKIGRGFIGAVLSKAGYDVCFADVDKRTVDLINARGGYDVHLMDEASYVEHVAGVSAVDSTTGECLERLAEADIVTTAVSMGVLPLIAPTIATGMELRRKCGNTNPLVVICCENGIRATSQLKKMVYAKLDGNTLEWADSHIAFADSGVDRIVPLIKCDSPLDVAVERFFEWNVDASQARGLIPGIEGMNLCDNLSAHIERKLYTVNTGHCSTAFLGNLKGYTYIGEALDDIQVHDTVVKVLEQSGAALVSKFGLDPEEQARYASTVIRRFRNPYLRDLVSRVAHDPRRKLGPTLYFSYPISMAICQGLEYDWIAHAAGAGLNVRIEGDCQCGEIREMIATMGLDNAIRKITGLKDSDAIGSISKAYRHFASEA